MYSYSPLDLNQLLDVGVDLCFWVTVFVPVRTPLLLTVVHEITSKHLFRFLLFLVELMALTHILPD